MTDDKNTVNRIARAIGGALGSAVGGYRSFARGATTELSVRKSADSWTAGLQFVDENPSELITKHGLDIIFEMREDDTIKPCLEGLKTTRLRSGWRIVPGSSDPVDIQIAEQQEADIRNMRGQIKNDLHEIATCREVGYSVTEVVRSKQAGADLRRPPLALKTRHPEGWKFDTDVHGNLRDMGLIQTIGGIDTPFDPWHFIIAVNKREFDNWYGQSDLVACYRAWNYKKWFMKFYAKALESQASGWWEGKIGDNAPPDAEAEMKAVLASIQSGTEITTPGWASIELHELAGGGIMAFERGIKLMNAGIAASLLTPEQIGFTQVEGGAYSKAQVHQQLWMGVIEDFGEDLADLIDEQLIRRNVDLHYPNVTEYPHWEWDPLTADDKQEMAVKVAEAVRGGLIHWTREDEVEARDWFDLPQVEGDVDPDTGEVQDAPTFSFSPRMFAKRSYKREFTAHEKRVNFTEIHDRTESVQEATIAELSALIETMRDDVLGRVDAMVVPKGAPAAAKEAARKAIKGHALPGVLAMNNTVKAALIMEHLGGKKDVIGEYEKAAGKKLKFSAEQREFADAVGIALIPKAALAYFKGQVPFTQKELALLADKAFWITDVTSRDILSKAQAILYKALGKGDPAWARKELRALFTQYVGSDGQLNDKGELLQPHRIDTIVRTNMSEAWNGGRMEQMRDPDVASMIDAYQYTAILDDNTTDYCAAMDGRVFDKDEIEAPPAHYNCRSFLVGVFKGDTYTLTTQADIRDEYRKAAANDRMKPWREKPINPDNIVRGRTFTAEGDDHVRLDG